MPTTTNCTTREEPVLAVARDGYHEVSRRYSTAYRSVKTQNEKIQYRVFTRTRQAVTTSFTLMDNRTHHILARETFVSKSNRRFGRENQTYWILRALSPAFRGQKMDWSANIGFFRSGYIEHVCKYSWRKTRSQEALRPTHLRSSSVPSSSIGDRSIWRDWRRRGFLWRTMRFSYLSFEYIWYYQSDEFRRLCWSRVTFLFCNSSWEQMRATLTGSFQNQNPARFWTKCKTQYRMG